MGISQNGDRAEKRRDWLRTRIVPVLALLLVIAIVVSIFYFYRLNPGRVAELQGYGYLGAFLISLILNATIVLPAGNILILATLGATMPLPVAVGIVGAVGAAIGELTGYVAGYSGQAIVLRQKMYSRLEGWMRKWGPLTVFLLSVAPLFFDLAGIAAGALRFPVWKFMLFCWLGRTILYVTVALAGAWGWETMLRYLG